MKLVVAIVPLEKLDVVRASLVAESRILSVTQVFSDKYSLGVYRGREFRIPRPELRVEIAVTDWLAEPVSQFIVEHAFTGDSADARAAKVFVLPMNAQSALDFQDEERLFDEPTQIRAR